MNRCRAFAAFVSALGGLCLMAAAAQTIQKMQFLNKLHTEAETLEASLEEAL